MIKPKSLAVIRGRLDRNAVLQQLGEAGAVFERSVLYPYSHFEAECKVPTIGGKKPVSLNCLVDGINGHGMTCDVFSTEKIAASGDKVLRSNISVDDAQKIARRTVTHGLGRKLKMIAPFDVQLNVRGVIYKRFFIVSIGNDRIMIDSVSGHTQSLRASAA